MSDGFNEKPASLVASEIPDAVYAVLADMDALFDMMSLSDREKLRYMGLFMYMRLQERPTAISPAELGKMLGALHNVHERFGTRQKPKAVA